MKKLLAMLLVCLMPLWAMAETYNLSIDVETKDAFVAFVTDVLVEQGEAETAEKTAAVMEKLINGLGMDLAFQEAAFSMDLRMAGKSFLDMTGYEKADQTLLTTSILPQYAMSSPNEEHDTTDFENVDWTGIGLSVLSTLERWSAGIEMTEANGIFVGDAYEGGTKCTTWMLDDQDLSALMREIMNEDVRAALQIFYTAADLNAADILASFDELNAKVAEDNRYAYMLRVVQDNDNQLVGISLTVAQDGEQAATASLGFLPDGVKIIIGLGLEQQNYWCDIVTRLAVADETLSMSATVREWAASKEDAFAYVQGVTAPVNTCVAQMDIASEDSSYTWKGAITANDNVILTTAGKCIPDTLVMEGVVSLGAEEKTLLSITFTFAETDEIPAMDESLTICSLTDPEDAMLADELSTQFAATLLARLMKLLPLDLIMQMNPFTMP